MLIAIRGNIKVKIQVSAFQSYECVIINKMGTSKIGAISKAQKPIEICTKKWYILGKICGLSKKKENKTSHS